MTDEVLVGLIGYGGAGARLHAPLIGAVDGLRVAAVVTRDPERAAHARAAIPDVRVLADPSELWTGAVDTVVIASPNASHVSLALAAVEAGVPVLVDKPLAVTAADAARVVAAAAASGTLLSVWQNRRWDTEHRTLRALLAAGELGDVLRYESRFERWRPEVKGGWRASGDPADGGGLLLDLGSHLVDQALHLFGAVTDVYAEVRTVRAGATVNDDTFVALTHAGGTVSHLWAGALTAAPGPRLRVLGSRSSFMVEGLDLQEAALVDGRLPDWTRVPESAWGTGGTPGSHHPVPAVPGDWREPYRLWREAVRGDGPAPVDPADAVATLQVLEAAQASATERRVVVL